MDQRIVISEALGITASVGFILRTLTVFILATAAYVQLNAKLDAVAIQGQRNAQQIEDTRSVLDRTRMDVLGTGIKLDEFLSTYDRDIKETRARER